MLHEGDINNSLARSSSDVPTSRCARVLVFVDVPVVCDAV